MSDPIAEIVSEYEVWCVALFAPSLWSLLLCPSVTLINQLFVTGEIRISPYKPRWVCIFVQASTRSTWCSSHLFIIACVCYEHIFTFKHEVAIAWHRRKWSGSTWLFMINRYLLLLQLIWTLLPTTSEQVESFLYNLLLGWHSWQM